MYLFFCNSQYFKNLLPFGLFSIGFFVLSSCQHKNQEKEIFQLLPSSKTNIHFNNILNDGDSPGILNYLYFYNGGGVAIGDINNDGLPDIYFTSNKKGGNKLYLNKGNYQFEDMTEKAGVKGTADWCTGVTMADVNNDGYLDIYVCAVAGKLGLTGHNMLYINNHDGTFTDKSKEYGLDFSGYSTQAAFFDYNHDGKLDCFLLNQSNHSVETYGDTSLRRKVNKLAGSKLYLNQNGYFHDVTLKSGIYSSALGYGLGLAIGDLNNDGWDDIYVGNDFHENDYYYINNHNGTFTESGANHFKHYSRFSMGNDIADFNNDGQLDIITADMLPGEENILKTYAGDESYDQYRQKIVNGGFQYQYSRNALQKNLGNGQAFSEVGLMDGVAATDWSWSPLFADFDNDGIKDLFIANGIKRRPTDMDYISFISNYSVQKMLTEGHQIDSLVVDKIPTGESHSYIFKGTKSEKFIDKSIAWGIKDAMLSNGAAYADLNNSGRLDLVTNNMNHEACIYRNVSTGTHYLSIKFVGQSDNKFGLGAKAYIFCGKQMQYEQLMLTRGFQSSVEPKLHFGLSNANLIDSLLIVWPNQTYQLLKHVKGDQLILADQKNATGQFNFNNYFKHENPKFEKITNQIKINWKHHENDFVDFNQQPLIPHMLSTEGPRIAVADVNHDGLEDFFVCGGKGQPGALFLQTLNGEFKLSNQPALALNQNSEGVDAVFIDVNKDGFPDLYVASGGNQMPNGSSELADHLYMNDGKGNFNVSMSIPALMFNKAAIATADVNHDGYPDLFVATAPDAFNFSKTPESYLLINNKHSGFIKVNIPDDLKYSGMIRSAAFADLDGDGWPDLVVGGEWMPIKIYLNKKGTFVLQNSTEIDKLTGWWQKIVLKDVNGDGKIDIIAGNYGENSKLKPDAENPVKLYLSDIDKNGTIDPILTYSINKNDYTFLGKGDIEKQIPILKKKFLYYHIFAGKNVTQIFGDSLGTQVLYANTFKSGIFFNLGNGDFKFQPFPSNMQTAPLFGFETFKQGGNGVLAGGNFYGVLPYEGRYDADYGDMLLIDKYNKFRYKSSISSGFLLNGEVRDIKAIKTAKGIIYVVAINNGKLDFFKIK